MSGRSSEPDHVSTTSYRLPIDTEFDVEFANELARLESFNRHHYRPNTYLHKWWARRCGSTFRLILKQLVENPDHRDYYSPGGLEGKVILDPMMGGGTTLHEALRMGANVIGMDIDPIPVLQARATMSDIKLSELEDAFDELIGSLARDLVPYFRTECRTCHNGCDLRMLLYGRQRICRCGQSVSVDSTIIRRETDGRHVRICTESHDVVREPHDCSLATESKPIPIWEKSLKSCPNCGEGFSELLDVPFFARFHPLAVAGQCPLHGLFYASPSDKDLGRISEADAIRSTLGEPPKMAVEPGPKSNDLLRVGVTNYSQLFSSRQLLYLRHASQNLQHFAWPVRRYLALLVSTSTEFNSMLCGYKGANTRRPGAIRHVFSHHAYTIPHTAVENNPLLGTKASGTLRKLFHDRVFRARKWAERPRERLIGKGPAKKVTIRGEKDFGVEVAGPTQLGSGQRRFLVRQASSAEMALPDASVDFIVTDPPYYDSIQYTNLASFFNVWLGEMLGDAMSDRIRWRYDPAGAAVSPTSRQYDRYVSVLASIFKECRRVMRTDRGRLIFTYHHWSAYGWAALTAALSTAGFALLNRYVVHSENPRSVHIAGLNSLTHDAVLVLAPRDVTGGTDWRRPDAVDTADSARFTGDCAACLGWMLSKYFGPDQILKRWKSLLAS